MEQYDEILKSRGPFRGYQRDLTDGGIRVPMIVRWPGRAAAGAENDRVWAFWDSLPTAAELAGFDPPADVDGISVVPTLLGKAQEAHEFLYWEFFERGFQQAVRHGDWKAIRLKQDAPLVLYNVKQDPEELRDVAVKHPEVIARIETYLQTARSDSEYWGSRGGRVSSLIRSAIRAEHFFRPVADLNGSGQRPLLCEADDDPVSGRIE